VTHYRKIRSFHYRETNCLHAINRLLTSAFIAKWTTSRIWEPLGSRHGNTNCCHQVRHVGIPGVKFFASKRNLIARTVFRRRPHDAPPFGRCSRRSSALSSRCALSATRGLCEIRTRWYTLVLLWRALRSCSKFCFCCSVADRRNDARRPVVCGHSRLHSA